MKRLQLIALLIAVSFGMTTPASSTTWKEIKDSTFEERMPYYIGLDDAYDLWSTLYRMKKDDRYCIPDDTDYEKIGKVAESLVKSDRSLWKEELSYSVYGSWAAEWPCR